ncbi:MAG: UDP-N-acetylmuramate--L-alanine ligase [bacterium]|nr:UDP-N-acetylmuramate--L-alanine ligase [bacterium]
MASWRLHPLRFLRLYTSTPSTPPITAYLIGIKGAGMTALAQVYAGRGIRVSGSDTSQRFYTDDVLRRAGISFIEHFAPGNIPADTDLVVRSTAYDADHVEVAEALRRGLRVLTYPEAIAEVFNAGKGIAVCGTHGKSTTTALLGWVLAEAGLDPTVIVGAEVPQFGGNARIGQSDIVVLEADEYQDKLQYLKPHGVILTSIEYDHPDFFLTPEAYLDTFRRFVSRIPADGFLVACTDDAVVQEVAKEASCAVIEYGHRILSQFRAKLRKDGADELAEIALQIPGRHNIQNALGVLAAIEHLGVSRDIALRALASFQGTRRRFETVGEVGGVTVVDDYGHHPTEIRVTLGAARERFPGRRILCAFHAHTFTRTIALQDQFATAFVSADHTYVMDIFGSARERQGGIDAVGLAVTISRHSPATASGGVEGTTEVLLRDVHPGDVVICMGAGENDRVARLLVERLRARTT